MTSDDGKKIMTIAEAVAYTGLPYSAIRRYVRDGSIAYVRSGTRYYLIRASIDKFLNFV